MVVVDVEVWIDNCPVLMDTRLDRPQRVKETGGVRRPWSFEEPLDQAGLPAHLSVVEQPENRDVDHPRSNRIGDS